MAISACAAPVTTPTVALSPTPVLPTATAAPAVARPAPTATAPPSATVTAAPTSTPAPSPTRAPATATAAAVGTLSAATLSAATSLRATPLRVGQAAVMQVATTPDGAVLYLVAGGALYRAEGGATTLVASPAPAGRLLALNLDRLVAGAAPACMRGGGEVPLRYSQDGGKSWRDAEALGGGPPAATPWLTDRGGVLALGCGGTLRGGGGGVRYEPVPALSPGSYEPKALTLSPDGGTAYLAAVSEGGTLWVLRAESSPLGGWSRAATVDTGWGIAALGVASDGRVYLGTATAVKVSADRGATWRAFSRGIEAELLSVDPTTGPLSPADQAKLRDGVGINDLAFAGNLALAATNHGIYASRDGGPWERWSDMRGRVTRLQAVGATVYASTADGVVALAP